MGMSIDYEKLARMMRRWLRERRGKWSGPLPPEGAYQVYLIEGEDAITLDGTVARLQGRNLCVWWN